MKIKQFGRCFKDLRGEIGKGPAYKKCLETYDKVEEEIDGEVLPDGKPKHDMYTLKEEALINRKIALLIEEAKGH